MLTLIQIKHDYKHFSKYLKPHKIKIYKIKNVENVCKISQTGMEHMNTYTLQRQHNLKS